MKQLAKTCFINRLEERVHMKQKAMERKEQGVTIMVGIILITFLICTMPAAIVLEAFPQNEQNSWVIPLIKM